MAGFERSAFGDGSTNVTTDVHNYFGARKAGGTDGTYDTDGASRESIYELTGVDIGQAVLSNRWLVQQYIPAGAIIEKVYAKVKEAFVLGGTTPTLNLGTDTSEGTNGAYLTQVQAQAVGTYDITSTLRGTWAAPLAAKTLVDTALGGTSPTVTTAGRVEFIVRFATVK